MSDATRNLYAEQGASAWRLEASLREFKPFKPVDFWFRYPIHSLDTTGELAELPAIGTASAGRVKNKKSKTAKECADEFRLAYDSENLDGDGVSVKDMAAHMELAERTLRERVKKMAGEFVLEDGIVRRAQ